MGLAGQGGGGKHGAGRGRIRTIDQDGYLGRSSGKQVGGVIGGNGDAHLGLAGSDQVVDCGVGGGNVIERKITGYFEGIQQGPAGLAVALVKNNRGHIFNIGVIGIAQQ